jgi:hypothetical protein
MYEQNTSNSVRAAIRRLTPGLCWSPSLPLVRLADEVFSAEDIFMEHQSRPAAKSKTSPKIKTTERGTKSEMEAQPRILESRNPFSDLGVLAGAWGKKIGSGMPIMSGYLAPIANHATVHPWRGVVM